MERISVVNNVKIITILYSSIFMVGDAGIIEPRSRVIAVQRRRPEFSDEEAMFSQFSFFSRPLPAFLPAEHIDMEIINENPRIEVGNVKVIGMSVAGVFQIGSNSIIHAKSRIKHIRHYLLETEQLVYQPNGLDTEIGLD